jgi:putative restriction endonuclease
MNSESNPHFRDRIRGTIYNYSSDGTYYKGEACGKKDIFYSVAGIGKGHWGVRNFEPSEENVDITEDNMGLEEGKRKLKQHIVRERNPQGEIGEEFVEGHHTVPVSELKEGQKTRVEDIALVCSNCHKMLHRRRPWLSKEELKKLISME